MKYIDTFSIWESKNNDIKYGCLMLYFNIDNWKTIIENIVDKNDLHEKGYEEECHVTILYGFLNDTNPNKVLDKCKTFPALSVFANKIGIFENEKFDVVKFDIQNDLLKELHEDLKEDFNTNVQYSYTPHVTIAYVKKGLGSKYVQVLNEQIKMTSSNFVYSDENKNKFKINDI